MHRRVDARRWARLLGAAVLGGALSAGVVAALPAEAAGTVSSAPRVSSGIDLNDLTEDGSYGDSGTTGSSDGNSLGNSLTDSDGNSLGNSLSDSDGNSLGNSLSDSDGNSLSNSDGNSLSNSDGNSL